MNGEDTPAGWSHCGYLLDGLCGVMCKTVGSEERLAGYIFRDGVCGPMCCVVCVALLVLKTCSEVRLKCSILRTLKANDVELKAKCRADSEVQ